MKYISTKILLASFSAFISFSASAALPTYNAPEILARANVTDGYNIPALSFLNNTSPVINNRGDVAFKIMAVEGENNQALWVKTKEDANGKIMYIAPEERFLTEPAISETGKIAFNLYDEGVTDGLFLFDSKTAEVKQVLNPDSAETQTIQFYTYPQVLSNGHIYFRATDDSETRLFYEFTGSKLNKILTEGVESLGIKSSYLFKPSVNDAGQIAFKARLGEAGQWDESNPDQILVLSPSTDPKLPGMKVTTIARDTDSDAHSLYSSFGNSVSISAHGTVSFMAILADSKKKTIVVARENTLKNVATEGADDISEIELFAPKVNDQGIVVFRAKDMSGKRGIYLADTTGVKKIISEGDVITTDLGLGKILSNPNFPGFSGAVDMNDDGVIVFYCMVVDLNNKELGSAIYQIIPQK